MHRLWVATGVLMLGWNLHGEVRPPAVAGGFYTANADELRAEVQRFLAAGTARSQTPAALIVPHAGYVYSGATAGKVFSALRGARLTRVIMLGPSHRASFAGGALPGAGLKAFATPLGEMPLDTEAIESLRNQEELGGPTRAHDGEHCLEVELPFLQETVGSVPIVPILVGAQTDRRTALGLARRLAPLVGPGVLVVVSSDFTHHGPSYGFSPFARDGGLVRRLEELGRATAERAAAVDVRGFSAQVDVSEDTVCGARPIGVLLELLAHAFTGVGAVVDVTTSASVSHSSDMVVSYAGVLFGGSWGAWREDSGEPELGTLDHEEEKAALALARATLETYLDHGPALARWFSDHHVTGDLVARSGVFVTIHNTGERAIREGRLRGCIGIIEAREPLVDAILHAAVSAAHDPRFSALQARELPGVTLEISVLSPMKQVAGADAIILGTHGVLLTKGGRSAVFLPQVATETGWDRATFLSHLSQKAGLPADAWKQGATFQVFTAQVFGEEETRR
ncbi:MAG TPA: AmmeMemoRadiSam system protein B [Thermoanaerobaculaceae bacterium]|nr:AmmeMemoRadiSam system protein B [Thermoanaerobaculaceae bacterium]